MNEIKDCLRRHIKKERASFHMPGHKGKSAILGDIFPEDILSFDVTELDGTDCLAHPGDAILKSEERAAKLCGAKRAYYLVNGSSCGILAMFYAYFGEGDTVIVDRTCHRSVINALTLCGIEPIYIAPEQACERSIPKGFTAEKIKKTLNKYPEAKGIFITSPNYYGMTSEIREIANLAHASSIPLLVDEAHGAHFMASNRLPESAIKQGADAAVVSLHKTLPCPNQTALLMINDEKMADKMQKAINVFQTTSPSYVLLSYIEAALALTKDRGAKLTDELLENLKPFSKYQTDDPFKLLVSFAENGLSGYETEKIFREEFGIFAELADEQNVLLMTSWANTQDDFELLKEALNKLSAIKKEKEILPISSFLFTEGKPQISPRKMRSTETEMVEIKNVAGRIAASTVVSFPPCIPIILPGESISTEQIEILLKLSAHTKIDGIADGNISVVKE